MNKVFGIVFLLFAAAAVQAENLLVGDTSVETEGIERLWLLPT